ALGGDVGPAGDLAEGLERLALDGAAAGLPGGFGHVVQVLGDLADARLRALGVGDAGGELAGEVLLLPAELLPGHGVSLVAGSAYTHRLALGLMNVYALGLTSFASQAARHLARSPGLDEHRISVPFTVRPSAPSWLQNAPGCTPDSTGGWVRRGFLVGCRVGRLVGSAVRVRAGSAVRVRAGSAVRVARVLGRSVTVTVTVDRAVTVSATVTRLLARSPRPSE